MRWLRHGIIATALAIAANPAASQDASGFNYICPAIDPAEPASPGACLIYEDSFSFITRLTRQLEESTSFIQTAADMPPPVGSTDFLLTPRAMLNPGRLSEFPPGRVGMGARQAVNIGTDAEIAALEENANARHFAVPALYRVVSERVTSVLDHGCASWFYNPVLGTVTQYNASRYTGLDVLGYIRQTGNTPQLDNSLTRPDGQSPQRFEDAAGQFTLTCTTETAGDVILRSANAESSAWSIFYDQMAEVLLGDGADATARARLLLNLISEMPMVETVAFSDATATNGTVLALDAILRQRFTDRGLTDVYPATMARFFDPDRPELLQPAFFPQRSGSVLRVDLGETVERKGEDVNELGTTPYVAILERGSEGATRRLVVDVSWPQESLPPDTIEDVHIIVNGEVYSESPGEFFDPKDPTIRAVITLDDPTVDRAYIGVAQVPENIDPATINDRLTSVAYNLDVTLEEVDLCDIALFEDFTNPRLARVSGNVGTDGRPNLPWLAQELGPRTQSSITLASPVRGVGDATVCVDHLATTQAGSPVISLYTPNPLTMLGGGSPTLSVEHDGWEGWPPNSIFKLTVILPGVQVGDLRSGRTYRAVMPSMMAEGFSAIYSDYEGRYTGPGPSDFEGQSHMLVAKGAQGFFAVTEAEAGFLRGNLTITGPAEFISWTHTRLDDGRYALDGDEEQTNLTITGEISVEATDDSLNLLREGANRRSAVID